MTVLLLMPWRFGAVVSLEAGSSARPYSVWLPPAPTPWRSQAPRPVATPPSPSPAVVAVARVRGPFADESAPRVRRPPRDDAATSESPRPAPAAVPQAPPSADAAATVPTAAATAATATTAHAPAAASAASAPLRLDADTIRRATTGIDGSVRRMAGEAGQALDTPRASLSQRQAEEVARTGKPDCIGPDAGGSLLSIPLIAIAAMRGKCK